jgi:hypothetical protein
MKLEIYFAVIITVLLLTGSLFAIRPYIRIIGVAFFIIIYLLFRLIFAVERVADAIEETENG